MFDTTPNMMPEGYNPFEPNVYIPPSGVGFPKTPEPPKPVFNNIEDLSKYIVEEFEKINARLDQIEENQNCNTEKIREDIERSKNELGSKVYFAYTTRH